MWGDSIWIELACKRDPTLVAFKGDIDKAKANLTSRNPGETARLDALMREELEKQFLRHGDDGLLEYILDHVSSRKDKDSRLAAIVTLATCIQTRKLYKPIAQCRGARPRADKIHQIYGKPEERRRLEEGAARYAGLKHRWHILLWIPSSSMRLKAAGVLVEDSNDQIVELKNLDAVVGRNQGREIDDSHKALWAISAFAPLEVKQDEERKYAALSWIAKKMSIGWDKTIPSLTTLAARHIGNERALARTTEEKLVAALDKELIDSGRTAVTLSSFNDLIDMGITLLEKMPSPEIAEEFFTEESVLKMLSRYLPEPLRTRDRQVIGDYVPVFVAKAKGLTKKQQDFLKRNLSSMEPKGGRQLEAAIIRLDSVESIKLMLEKLLDQARSQK